MPLGEEDVVALVHEVIEERQCFHSEADLQFAFACHLATARPGLPVRCGIPFPGKVRGHRHFDIRAGLGPEASGFEVKYPKRGILVSVSGEPYDLRESPGDTDCYDICMDVQRLELLVAPGEIAVGYAVAVTNLGSLWRGGRSASCYEDFKIRDGRSVRGLLRWGPTAGTGTRDGRDHPIELAGSYQLTWRPDQPIGPAGMRFLIVRVPPSG